MADFNRLMTAGDIVKEACAQQGLPVPGAVVTNPNDKTAQQMWALLRTVGRRLLKPQMTHRWEVLKRTWVLDTVPAQTLYDLPTDFDSFEDLTGWNFTSRLPMLGPATDPQWQCLKARNLGSSTISVIYRQAGGKFEIYNTFSTPQNLQIVYTSRAWVQKAGSLPVQYADMPQADDDLVLYDPELVVCGLQMAFMTAKGFDTASISSTYNTLLEAAVGSDTDAPVLQTSVSGGYPYLNAQFNVPDTGFGS
jgi:hypothetical protein